MQRLNASGVKAEKTKLLFALATLLFVCFYFIVKHKGSLILIQNIHTFTRKYIYFLTNIYIG